MSYNELDVELYNVVNLNVNGRVEGGVVTANPFGVKDPEVLSLVAIFENTI